MARLRPSEEGKSGEPLIMGKADSEDETARALKVYVMEKWEENVYDCENDVAGLCVSFLTTQAFRFNISGVLPNSMGIEEEDYIHEFKCVLLLIGVAGLCACGTMALVLVRSKIPENVVPGTAMSLYKRGVIVSQNASAMCFAWSLLYAAKWEMARLLGGLGSPNNLKSRVLLALGLSLGSFCLIFILDMAADSPVTGDLADLGIISIIGSLGILVGFAWEQSFDGGVEVISQLTPYPICAQGLMAVLVAMVVVTPWRRYILDTVIALSDHRAGIAAGFDAGQLGLAVHMETQSHRTQRLEAASREASPGRSRPEVTQVPQSSFAKEMRMEQVLEQSAVLQRENVVLKHSLQELELSNAELRHRNNNGGGAAGEQLVVARVLPESQAIRTLPELPEGVQPEVRSKFQTLLTEVQSLELQRSRDAESLVEMRELRFHSDVKLQMIQGEFDRLMELYKDAVGGEVPMFNRAQ